MMQCGMYVEKCDRTWESHSVPGIGRMAYEDGRIEVTERESNLNGWQSDQFIVLRERESRLHGEGTDGNTQPAKET